MKKSAVFLTIILALGTFFYAEEAEEFFSGRFYYILNEKNEAVITSDMYRYRFDGELTVPKNMEALTIPSEIEGHTVTEIQSNVCSNQSYLTSVYIPSSVTTIGENAFKNSSRVTSFIIDENNPRYAAKDGIIYEKDSFNLVSCYQTSGTIKVPYGAKEIPARFFEEVVGFAEAEAAVIEIPETVTSIGDYAFKSAFLKAIKFAENINIKNMGREVFNHCHSKIIPFPNGPEEITEKTFSGAAADLVYISDSVTKICTNSFANCHEVRNIRFSNNLKTIETLSFEDFTPWYTNECPTFVLPESLEHIDGYAFKDASVDIVLPSSMTTIDKYAFAEHSFANVVIPDGLTKIEEGAFYKAGFINNLKLPEGLLYIGDKAFFGSDFEYYPEFRLPDSVEYIGESAFEESWMFPEDFGKLPASLKTIGKRAFANSGSDFYIIPEGVTEIPDEAFKGCTSLSMIEMTDSVISIGNEAFADCEGLNKIELSEKIKNVGTKAFYNCHNIEKIVLPLGVKTAGKNIVSKGTRLVHQSVAVSFIYVALFILSVWLLLRIITFAVTRKFDGKKELFVFLFFASIILMVMHTFCNIREGDWDIQFFDPMIWCSPFKYNIKQELSWIPMNLMAFPLYILMAPLNTLTYMAFAFLTPILFSCFNRIWKVSLLGFCIGVLEVLVYLFLIHHNEECGGYISKAIMDVLLVTLGAFIYFVPYQKKLKKKAEKK